MPAEAVATVGAASRAALRKKSGSARRTYRMPHSFSSAIYPILTSARFSLLRIRPSLILFITPIASGPLSHYTGISWATGPITPISLFYGGEPTVTWRSGRYHRPAIDSCLLCVTDALDPFVRDDPDLGASPSRGCYLLWRVCLAGWPCARMHKTARWQARCRLARPAPPPAVSADR